jgi:hypothetical protein
LVIWCDLQSFLANPLQQKKKKSQKKLTNGFKIEGTEEEIVAGALVHLAGT